jgi:Ran GTPase-activating protein (RanGAP) involved in mRNA processing and transport
MSPSGTVEAPRRRALDPEVEGELEAKRAERRRAQAMWKKIHYKPDDLSVLRVLHFGNANLTDDDGVALFGGLTKQMVQLRELHLYNNRLQDTAMRAIADAIDRGAAPKLSLLDFGRNAIANEGLIAFAEALGKGGLPHLARLFLFHNRIGSAGVGALADAAEQGALANLVTLGLSGNAIGDEGVKALASACSDSDVLPNLAELHIRATAVSDSPDGGLMALGEALLPRTGGLPSLRTLYIDEEHTSQPRLKEACAGRTGHGDPRVHALKLLCY